MTTTPPASDGPPDWATQKGDVTCPLCGYNLRGLTDPRCPECGFAFGWVELLADGRNRHPWLFEHGRRRNGRTFVATWLRTPFARRFWRQVTPANAVHGRRLVAYWLIACLPLFAIGLESVVAQVWELGKQNLEVRRTGLPIPRSAGATTYLYWRSGPLTRSQMDAEFPSPWSADFAVEAWHSVEWRRGGAYFWSAAAVAGWPWLSLLTLSLFHWSMRRARVSTAHVARVAVYGCDFAPLMLLAAAAYFGLLRWPPFEASVSHLFWSPLFPSDFGLAVWTALACAAVATIRMTAAYARYLRFHVPLATVLVSQAVALTIAAAVADFTLI